MAEILRKSREMGIKRTINEIKITSINAVHGNGCTPGFNQAQHCLRAAGKLLKKSTDKLIDAVNLVNSTHVRPTNLRQLLAPLLPRDVALAPQDLVNFRLWAKVNGRKIQNATGATVPFGSSKISRMLSGKTLEYKDLTLSQPAINDSASILNSVLAQCLSSDEAIVLIQYLDQLKQRDHGFDFRAAYASDGKLTGVVWQTSSMRAAFVTCRECLFLDFMKRKLNRLNWPYIGPCVIDRYKKVRVVAEDILVSEKADSYSFVLRSLFDMSGDYRKKEHVYAVFPDGFFSDDILTASGIGTTCRYFWDQYHLLQKDWPDYFGSTFSGDFADYLRKMMYASTEAKFETAYQRAKECIAQNPKHLDYVLKLGRNRNRFASYAIENAKGTMLRHGSSHAEQNHSSIIAHIGDHLYEDPSVEVRLLLDRQRDLNLLLSQQISKHVLISVSERAQLESQGIAREIAWPKFH